LYFSSLWLNAANKDVYNYADQNIEIPRDLCGFDGAKSKLIAGIHREYRPEI